MGQIFNVNIALRDGQLSMSGITSSIPTSEYFMNKGNGSCRVISSIIKQTKIVQEFCGHD